MLDMIPWEMGMVGFGVWANSSIIGFATASIILYTHAAICLTKMIARSFGSMLQLIARDVVHSHSIGRRSCIEIVRLNPMQLNLAFQHWFPILHPRHPTLLLSNPSVQ
jgi:hypothetical protein